MAAHQAPSSLGFSRQEHWSGLPVPPPMHESESESEVIQSYPTLSNPMDCSLPGSSVHGIFQARVLEQVAIAFSADDSMDAQISTGTSCWLPTQQTCLQIWANIVEAEGMTCSLKPEMTYTLDRALRCLQNFYSKDRRHFPDVLASIHFLPHSSWQPLNCIICFYYRKNKLLLNMCSVASVVSDSVQPYGLQPARLLCPWVSPRSRILEWVAMTSSRGSS